MSAAYLMVRRSGTLWGLSAAAVAGVDRGGERLRIRLAGGGAIEVEAIVGMAERLDVRAAPAAARRRLPDGTRGLALHDGEPLLVLDERSFATAGGAGA